MSLEESPYQDQKPEQWEETTRKIIKNHPISQDELKKTVLDAWDSILKTNISKYKIGEDIFPTQQMIGFLLQQLVSLHFENKYPEIWRGEKSASDKDMVCLTDDNFSMKSKHLPTPTKFLVIEAMLKRVQRVRRKNQGIIWQ